MPSNPEVRVTRGRIKNTNIDTTFQRREAKNGLRVEEGKGELVMEKRERGKSHTVLIIQFLIPVKLRQEAKYPNNR